MSRGPGLTTRIRWQLRTRRDSRRLHALLAAELASDSNVVDVGAHVGDFLALCYEHAPRGRHVAIEPLPACAERIRERFPQATLIQTALSDTPADTAPFYLPETMQAWAGLQRQEYPGETDVAVIDVPVTRLDDVLDERPVALLKLDAEGAEAQVLRGASGLLERERPLLYFEYARIHADPYGVGPGDMHDTLSELGYAIHGLGGGAALSRDVFAAACERAHASGYDRRAETNWVGRPR